jgi:hypothetical protein
MTVWLDTVTIVGRDATGGDRRGNGGVCTGNGGISGVDSNGGIQLAFAIECNESLRPWGCGVPFRVRPRRIGLGLLLSREE